MSIISLDKMAIGQHGEVAQLAGDGQVCGRLLEMGLTPGVALEVVRFAPMGDPIEIKIRGYHLSLRRQEAQVVQVLIKKKV